MRLLADINQSLTPAQREHTIERLRGVCERPPPVGRRARRLIPQNRPLLK
jgi:hypothetical protein